MTNGLRLLIYSFLAVPIFFAAAFSQTPSPSPTPAPQSSDIFVVDVKSQDGQMKFGQPMKITNTVGYNNQPSFLPDGHSILYTSIRDKQADIYRYDIRSSSATQITNTPRVSSRRR